MATHSSILVWRVCKDREPGRLHGVAESDVTERLRESAALPWKARVSGL